MLDFSKPSISHAQLLGRLHKTLWYTKTYKKTHTKNQNKQYNQVSKKSSQTWFTISHFLICALKVTGPPSVPSLINLKKFNLPPHNYSSYRQTQHRKDVKIVAESFTGIHPGIM